MIVKVWNKKPRKSMSVKVDTYYCQNGSGTFINVEYWRKKKVFKV